MALIAHCDVEARRRFGVLGDSVYGGEGDRQQSVGRIAAETDGGEEEVRGGEFVEVPGARREGEKREVIHHGKPVIPPVFSCCSPKDAMQMLRSLSSILSGFDWLRIRWNCLWEFPIGEFPFMVAFIGFWFWTLTK